MRIAVINGNPDESNIIFDKKIDDLSAMLTEKGNIINNYKLRDMKINKCIGCYACWLKTPGICIHKDDMHLIITEYVNSDLVILCSTLLMNFISSHIKKTQERLLPLALPFIFLKGDRNQHYSRYDKVARIMLLLDRIDPDGIEIIESVFRSQKTREFVFTRKLDDNIKELADEINGI
jgi:multimeric flavodoxin WrbA